MAEYLYAWRGGPRIKGETSPDAWYVHYERQVAVLEAAQEVWEQMSPAERAHCEAICERAREFADAVEAILADAKGNLLLGRRAEPRR